MLLVNKSALELFCKLYLASENTQTKLNLNISFTAQKITSADGKTNR